MCYVTIVGPPEFDQYAAACYACPWSGPERTSRFEASKDAREHRPIDDGPVVVIAKDTDENGGHPSDVPIPLNPETATKTELLKAMGLEWLAASVSRRHARRLYLARRKKANRHAS